jgi:hypothetical protein
MLRIQASGQHRQAAPSSSMGRRHGGAGSARALGSSLRSAG